MNVSTWIFMIVLYLAMGAVMVINNGWAMAGLLIAVLAVPMLIFGLLPYLLGDRPAGGSGGNKGYFYGYKYKFGAKPPKF